MEQIRQFVSAILAGFMIGMGGTVFLSLDNKALGACMFGVGLFTVVVFRLQLFTGKIGYIPFQKKRVYIRISYHMDWKFLWYILLQNVYKIQEFLQKKCQIKYLLWHKQKLNDNLFSIFILSIFCGILMFIAVDTFREQQGSTIKGDCSICTCYGIYIKWF